MLIGGKEVHLCKADNPTNLNWEYFGCPKHERKFRAFIMWVTTFVVLIFTFIAVILLQVYKA